MKPEQRLLDHVEKLHRAYTDAKSEAERIAKELSALGVRLTDPLKMYHSPLDDKFLKEVTDALKDGGKNVKQLQKALGIFDQSELTRKRKVLVAAGVIRETENYNGTNRTMIELVEETTTGETEQPAESGDTADGSASTPASESQEEEATSADSHSEPTSPATKPTTPKAAPKK